MLASPHALLGAKEFVTFHNDGIGPAVPAAADHGGIR
jgi:hypothetical protein